MCCVCLSRVRGINAGEEVVVPSDVTVTVNARVVKVTGKRGTLERSFKHASVEMSMGKNAKGEIVVKVRPGTAYSAMMYGAQQAQGSIFAEASQQAQL